MSSDRTIGETSARLEPRQSLRRFRGPLLVLIPLLAIAIAIAIYLHGGRFESTDNAYIQSGRGAVSTSVAGRVVAVAVQENQTVKTGQLLFALDPSPFQAEVDQAEAQLAAARLQVDALRANLSQGQSELKAVADRAKFADRELARQKNLLAEGISSQAQYDQAALNAQAARQGIQTTQQQNASVLANLAGRADLPTNDAPLVRQAQAALERAKLRLGYTKIYASQDGIVTKVNQLQVGNYVDVAKPLFYLVGQKIWIDANFKEDQLNHMRVGQPATVKIDAFPDLDLTAHVSSFSPGTGSSFSVLPAENATGNWVKVVQRLPIELSFDHVPAGVPLHAGLSARVVVDTGYKRHLFGGGSAPAQAAPAARP